MFRAASCLNSVRVLRDLAISLLIAGNGPKPKLILTAFVFPQEGLKKPALLPMSCKSTLSMVYKKRCKIETSPFLSIFCWCYCSVYDVIASLLLNKASKVRLVVPYKGVSYKPY